MEEKTSRRGYGRLILIAALLLTVFYVLSVGPAVWIVTDLGDTPWSEPTEIAFQNAYWPLELLAEICPPFERFLMWYVSFFEPSP